MKEKFIYNFCKKTVDKSILIVYSSCYDKVVVPNGNLIFFAKDFDCVVTKYKPAEKCALFFSYKRIKI